MSISAGTQVVIFGMSGSGVVLIRASSRQSIASRVCMSEMGLEQMLEARLSMHN
jgi:hypothetical protein